MSVVSLCGYRWDTTCRFTEIPVYRLPDLTEPVGTYRSLGVLDKYRLRSFISQQRAEGAMIQYAAAAHYHCGRIIIIVVGRVATDLSEFMVNEPCVVDELAYANK